MTDQHRGDWLGPVWGVAVALQVFLCAAWVWGFIIWPCQIGISQEETSRRQAECIPFWTWEGRLISLFLLACLILWLRDHWEGLARRFYHTFMPHSAAPAVRRSLAARSSSRQVAEHLASSFSEPPARSSVLRRVRFEQSERLYDDLVAGTTSRQDEIARRAKAVAAQAHEEAAHYGIQEALAYAASALERSKAALRRADHLRGKGRS